MLVSKYLFFKYLIDGCHKQGLGHKKVKKILKKC